MKTPTQKASDTLAKIREMIEDADCGFDNPEAKRRFAGFIQILKMHTSGFLPNDTQRIYLGEQIYKLNEYKEDLFAAGRPRFWQTHGECQTDMLTRCSIAQGLIERHAKEYEQTPATAAG